MLFTTAVLRGKAQTTDFKLNAEGIETKLRGLPVVLFW